MMISISVHVASGQMTTFHLGRRAKTDNKRLSISDKAQTEMGSSRSNANHLGKCAHHLGWPPIRLHRDDQSSMGSQSTPKGMKSSFLMQTEINHLGPALKGKRPHRPFIQTSRWRSPSSRIGPRHSKYVLIRDDELKIRDVCLLQAPQLINGGISLHHLGSDSISANSW